MEPSGIAETLEPSLRSPYLIKAHDCFVLIIDVQEPFLEGLMPDERATFLQKHVWLIQVCDAVGIPYILTTEDVAKNGSIHPSLTSQLQKEKRTAQIFDKFFYSCWGQIEIREAIQATGRSVAVLCGLETDVCISQTALDLLGHGYRVAILVDLTYSRNEFEHTIGLKRMAYHGTIFTSLKSWQEEITGGLKTKINRRLIERRLTDIPQ